jgi:hypothetical protein
MGWRAGEDVLWPYSRHSLNFPGGTDITTRTSVRIWDGRVIPPATVYLWSLCPHFSFPTQSFLHLHVFMHNSLLDMASSNKNKVYFHTWHWHEFTSPVRAKISAMSVPILFIAIVADNAFDLRDLTADVLPCRRPPSSSLSNIQWLAGRWVSCALETWSTSPSQTCLSGRLCVTWSITAYDKV